MAQTIECGACQGSVPIAEEVVGRCVVCPTCGQMLAVVAPPPAPPTPRRPAAPVAPEPALADWPARLRARYLVEPWPQVLRGLVLARWTTIVSAPLQVLYVVAAVAIVRLKPEHVAVAQMATLVYFGLLVLLSVVHFAAQLMASLAPREVGGTRMATSCGFTLAAVVAFGGCLLQGWALAAVVSSSACLAVSFGVWLSGLRQLGDGLNDRQLRERAAWAVSRYVFVAVVTVVLTGYAIVDVQLALACGLASGALSLYLTAVYLRLLWAAEAAVAGRGPVNAPTEPLAPTP